MIENGSVTDAPDSEQPGQARDPGRVGGPAGEALEALLRLLARRGRDELDRAAARARHHLELRQLRRDRDAMVRKLGKEARALLEAGEIDHPGLRRGVERIEALEARIAALERGEPAGEGGDSGPSTQGGKESSA